MLKIGIISDSHYKSDVAASAIKYLKNKKIDLLLHAGDIVELSTLKIIKRSKIPNYTIIGNNDFALRKYKGSFSLFEEPQIIGFKNLRIKLMHYPFYFDNDVDIVVYGHTHYFAAVINDNTLYINPGEICGRKKPLYEFAYIVYNEEKFRVFKIESKISKTIKWIEKEVAL